MSFCTKCGRQRNGAARFCGGCGTEFTDPVPVPIDQEPPAADAPPPGDAASDAASDATPPGPAADATRLDMDPGVTRVEPPAAAADPFPSWYRQEPPAAGRQEDDMAWQPTQTAQATPALPGGYPPSYPPPAAYPPPAGPPPLFPPGPPAEPPSRGSRGTGLFIALAAIVVLAAGGGAYALTASLGKHPGPQPSASPTVSGSSPTTGAAPAASSAATSSDASPTLTPTPVPSPTLSLVAISPSVTTSAAVPRVETVLSHYFHGINTHNYREYASTLNAAQLASQPQSQFDSGYSSTSDSGMTLTGLSGNGNGGLTATVTFTSRQSPSQSVDNSACDAWTLNFYLVPHGSGYLVGPEPSGYQPTYSDC